MTEFTPSLTAVVCDTMASAAQAIGNRALRRKKAKPDRKPEAPRPQQRGTVAYCYGGKDNAPKFKATCKFMGCRETLYITAPGYKDSEDRELVAKELINRGWCQSVFDGKLICAKHTESNPK